ncbi:MAG: TIM barrel protein [Lentisphaerae bacterium]|nr:TIM barrel protein [Lentisphaerota bacterium]
MIFPGLVSVTFRQLKPDEIVRLAAAAGLKGIEWGGDIHVPPGKSDIARQVRRLTQGAGLQVASYGSYYSVGVSRVEEFGNVLDTAGELGAPIIRIWAGNQGSAQPSPPACNAMRSIAGRQSLSGGCRIAGGASEDYRRRLADITRELADQAKRRRLDLAFEFHGGTLTDTVDSTLALLSAINHPNVKTYWQPSPPACNAMRSIAGRQSLRSSVAGGVPAGIPIEDCAEGLKRVLPWLANIHVGSWSSDWKERRALSENEAAWQRFLNIAAVTGRDHFALLEFVCNDDPAVLGQDAATLKQLLAGLRSLGEEGPKLSQGHSLGAG